MAKSLLMLEVDINTAAQYLLLSDNCNPKEANPDFLRYFLLAYQYWESSKQSSKRSFIPAPNF